jgi:2,3-bisphosphoglycerate-dependent phosphoglycerate mutase
MQLYFIRHAQSENNLLFVQTGASKGRSDDPGLTPAGQKQALALARFLKQQPNGSSASASRHDPQNVAGFGLTHLYCSLMIRAIDTATVLARGLDLPLLAWEDLHEAGGIYRIEEQTGERIGLPGKNRKEFEALYPELVLPESLPEQGWWNRPFESRPQRPLRARRFLRDLLDRHGNSDDRVAVVSHGGFYNYLLGAILDLQDRETFWFTLNNGAITRIDFEHHETWLGYMNRLDFMPRELVT